MIAFDIYSPKPEKCNLRIDFPAELFWVQGLGLSVKGFGLRPADSSLCLLLLSLRLQGVGSLRETRGVYLEGQGDSVSKK